MGSNGEKKVDQRGSGKLRKRYRLPPGCSCKEFVMRELTNADRLEAAIRADASKSSAMPDDIGNQIEHRRVEAVRLSLVSVDGKPVNVDLPYAGMDAWTERTLTFAMTAYQDLNGIEPEEVEDFLKGAEPILETCGGAAAEPTTAP